jgi:hypothetical protein
MSLLISYVTQYTFCNLFIITDNLMFSPVRDWNRKSNLFKIFLIDDLTLNQFLISVKVINEKLLWSQVNLYVKNC